MSRMRLPRGRWMSRRRGASMAEYIIVVFFASLSVLSTIHFFGDNIRQLWSAQGNCLAGDENCTPDARTADPDQTPFGKRDSALALSSITGEDLARMSPDEAMAAINNLPPTGAGPANPLGEAARQTRMRAAIEKALEQGRRGEVPVYSDSGPLPGVTGNVHPMVAANTHKVSFIPPAAPSNTGGMNRYRPSNLLPDGSYVQASAQVMEGEVKGIFGAGKKFLTAIKELTVATGTAIGEGVAYAQMHPDDVMKDFGDGAHTAVEVVKFASGDWGQTFSRSKEYVTQTSQAVAEQIHESAQELSDKIANGTMDEAGEAVGDLLFNTTLQLAPFARSEQIATRLTGVTKPAASKVDDVADAVRAARKVDVPPGTSLRQSTTLRQNSAPDDLAIAMRTAGKNLELESNLKALRAAGHTIGEAPPPVLTPVPRGPDTITLYRKVSKYEMDRVNGGYRVQRQWLEAEKGASTPWGGVKPGGPTPQDVSNTLVATTKDAGLTPWFGGDDALDMARSVSNPEDIILEVTVPRSQVIFPRKTGIDDTTAFGEVLVASEVKGATVHVMDGVAVDANGVRLAERAAAAKQVTRQADNAIEFNMAKADDVNHAPTPAPKGDFNDPGTWSLEPTDSPKPAPRSEPKPLGDPNDSSTWTLE